MEKEKWLEDNSDQLNRLDRLSTSSQSQLVSALTSGHHEHSGDSLSGYQEGILEALRRAAHSHRGSNSTCSGTAILPGDFRGSGSIGPGYGVHLRSSSAFLTDEICKSLAESYFDQGRVEIPPTPLRLGGQAFSDGPFVSAAIACALKKSFDFDKLDGVSCHQGVPLKI